MCSTYVFIDNSNIWIGARTLCEKREGLLEVPNLRLFLLNLKLLASAGRRNTKFRVFSSRSLNDSWSWISAEGEDLKNTIFERGICSGSEQAVDEAIQLAMYRVMLEAEEPGVVVLLTGDGKGFEQNIGFTQTLYDMYHHGWGVEVLSWEDACHHELRQFAEENGVFISLDEYYPEVTYLKNGRYAKALSLKHRKTAQPDIMKDSYLRIRLLMRQNECLQQKMEAVRQENKELHEKYDSISHVQIKKELKKKKYVKSMKNKQKNEKQQKLTELPPPNSIPYELYSGMFLD